MFIHDWLLCPISIYFPHLWNLPSLSIYEHFIFLPFSHIFQYPKPDLCKSYLAINKIKVKQNKTKTKKHTVFVVTDSVKVKIWVSSTVLKKKRIFLKYIYRQPNKIMVYLTFHKWLVSVCNMHNDIWMLQTKTSHLGKVSYAIILLGWRYYIP